MAVVPKATIPGLNPGGGIGGIRVPTQAPLQSFGGDNEAFGASAGLAQEAGKVFQQHLDDAVQAQTVDNVSQLAAEETRLKLQLQQVRGKDALEAANKATSDFDTFKSKLLQNSQNPTVQRSTAAHAEQYKNSLNAWGQSYATQQFQSWDSATVRAGVENEMNAAIVDGSPARISEAINRQKAIYSDYSKRAGWSPEELKLNSDAAVSATHLGVLSMMLDNGNDLAASTYYDAHKSELVGNDALKAAKIVHSQSKLGEATRLVDKAFTGVVSDFNVKGWGVIHPIQDNADIQKIAATIQDPSVRQEFIRQSKERLGEIEQDKHRASSDAFDDIYKKMQQPANAGKSPIDLATPNQRENILSPHHWDALLQMAKRERVTDEDTMTHWWALQADPRKVAALDEADLTTLYLSKFSVADAEKARSMWATARKEVAGDPLKASEAKSSFNDSEMVFHAMSENNAGGITDSDTLHGLKGDKAASFNRIRRAADDAWIAAAQRNNGKLSDPDRKRILAEILAPETPVVIPHDYPSTLPFVQSLMGPINETKLMRDLTPEERTKFVVPLDKIPAAVIRDMTNFIVQLPGGKAVTTDKLQRMRRARLLGDDAALLRIANE